MSNHKGVVTLDEFTIEETRKFKNATGELSSILRDIGLAAKIINQKVSRAGLEGILGKQGATNIQGEEQMKLDVFSDDTLIQILNNTTDCAGIASEENDTIIAFEDEYSRNSKYVILFDPLDGSSNIDVNASIGTIFAIYKRKSPTGEIVTEKDFLQEGKYLMAAGYVIYGSSTMLVYATRLGVNGFTLEPSIGEFCLSHQNMTIPIQGNIYSINQGNSLSMEKWVQEYIEYCMQENTEEKRPYKHRYIGSMVADLHRTLIKGGIFLYPSDTQNKTGKLRLMYECNPMAFIIEKAGGLASTGTENILDVSPMDLHQRVPIIIGSKDMVSKCLSFKTMHSDTV